MNKNVQILLVALLISVNVKAQFQSAVTPLGSLITAKIETSTTTVKLTLTGPLGVYFAIGFGGTSMSSVNDAFIWNGTTDRDYTISGRSVVADVSQSWTVITDITGATTRTVEATRTLASSGDYTFANAAGTFNVIYAYGNDENVAYHANRGSTTITLVASSLSLQPINLIATKQNNSIALNWQVASNANVLKYEVERSTDGLNFNAIYTLANSNINTTNYFYTDNTLTTLPNIFYYRIKATNNNASIIYSNLYKVVNTITDAALLYPNITKNNVELQLLDNTLIGTNAILINGKGNVLKSIAITGTYQIIPLSKYAAGMYFLKLQTGLVLKIIKK